MVNKTELINAAAEAAQMTKKDAAAVVNAVLDTIAQTLADGDKVQLVGFGNFEIRERKARAKRQGGGVISASSKSKGNPPAAHLIRLAEKANSH